jgi:hypothetical protein
LETTKHKSNASLEGAGFRFVNAVFQSGKFLNISRLETQDLTQMKCKKKEIRSKGRKVQPISDTCAEEDFSLAETPGHVIFGSSLRGICKNFNGIVVFDQLAQIEERSVVRNSCCLLHIMGDNHNCVVFP